MLRACLIESVYAVHRNPNCWFDCNEIWYEGGPQGGKVLGWVLTWYHNPLGYESPKGGLKTFY